MIRCGHCKHSHETVAQVRGCHGLESYPNGVRKEAVLYDSKHDYGKDIRDLGIYIGPRRKQEPRAQPAVEVAEGMWKLGDRIIKIQRAVHGSGRLYGKELTVRQHTVYTDEGRKPGYEHSWKILTGAVRMLREQGGRPMTLEEAVEFGALYGFCCRCGRTLTDEGSIEAGIGPVCAQKFSS